jgi:hypothetical protein
VSRLSATPVHAPGWVPAPASPVRVLWHCILAPGILPGSQPFSAASPVAFFPFHPYLCRWMVLPRAGISYLSAVVAFAAAFSPLLREDMDAIIDVKKLLVS